MGRCWTAYRRAVALREVRKARWSAAEKMLVLVLVDRADDNTGESYPSYKTLEADTGFSESTLRRALKTLQARKKCPIKVTSAKRYGSQGQRSSLFSIYLTKQALTKGDRQGDSHQPSDRQGDGHPSVRVTGTGYGDRQGDGGPLSQGPAPPCQGDGHNVEPDQHRPKNANDARAREPAGVGAGLDLTPEEAELVAQVRADAYLGPLLPKPQHLVRAAASQLATGTATLDGLKRSVAAASAKLGKLMSAGDEPDGVRVAGILEWHFRHTQDRERREREEARASDAEDPDAQRKARLMREAQERKAQADAEAQAMPPRDLAARAVEMTALIAGIGNGGTPAKAMPRRHRRRAATDREAN